MDKLGSIAPFVYELDQLFPVKEVQSKNYNTNKKL